MVGASGSGDLVYGTPNFALVYSLYAFMGWCLLLTALGFGMQYLVRSNRVLEYANEAVLPFYTLHQTVLFTIGYVVVQMPMPDLLK